MGAKPKDWYANHFRAYCTPYRIRRTNFSAFSLHTYYFLIFHCSVYGIFDVIDKISMFHIQPPHKRHLIQCQKARFSLVFLIHILTIAQRETLICYGRSHANHRHSCKCHPPRVKSGLPLVVLFVSRIWKRHRCHHIQFT